MWILNSYTAKVIVWLAAALMPGEMLFAGSCGCGEQNASDVQGKTVKTLTAACFCCQGGAVCRCCHRAQKSQQSACCKNRTGQSVSSRSAIVTLCTCPGSRAPAPQIPPPDSSTAKQLLGQAHACLGPAAVAEIPSPTLHSMGNCPSLPATPLERLSNLCRLII